MYPKVPNSPDHASLCCGWEKCSYQKISKASIASEIKRERRNCTNYHISYCHCPVDQRQGSKPVPTLTKRK